VPHFAEDLWEMLGHGEGVVDAAWPAFDQTVASAEEITIVIQVNGKVRSRITVPPEAGEEKIKDLARTDGKVAKLIAGKDVVKEIYVPKKLVNIVIRGQA
jgi:leucyl-tRNA synthetase